MKRQLLIFLIFFTFNVFGEYVCRSNEKFETECTFIYNPNINYSYQTGGGYDPKAEQSYQTGGGYDPSEGQLYSNNEANIGHVHHDIGNEFSSSWSGGGYDDGNYSPEDWETEKQRRIEKIDEVEKRNELNKLKNTPINKLNIVEQKRKTNLLKKECKELGFKEGSKKFKDCVVELME